MTTITREQIEYCIKTNSSTEDEHRQICALALRALDTTSVKPSQSIVEAVARAWASIDGHADDFEAGKSASDVSAFGGRYAGYMEDAEELLKRSGIVGLIEAKAYERAALLAKKQAFFCSQQAEDCPLSRRLEWLEYSKTLAEFADAIRALSPSTTRYVELPEGHVVVPLNPTEAMWGGDLVRLLMVWCEGPKITPRSLIEAAKFRGIQLPEWLLKEKEMDALDHTVSKGTRATLIYRAMIEEVKLLEK